LQNCHPSPSLKQHGFTYTEVMLSAVLLAVLLVPALQALQTGIAGGANRFVAARSPLLSAKMEEVLSKPFPDLYAETYLAGANTATSVSITYSDSGGVNDRCAPARCAVVLYRYDASTRALSPNDTGLLYISVYYADEGSANALNTLAGRWW
jgi:type II secretory pathway pseudopilin PulG